VNTSGRWVVPCIPKREVQEWVQGRLHELRHGEEEKFLAKLKRLKPRRGEVGKTIREQKNYLPIRPSG